MTDTIEHHPRLEAWKKRLLDLSRRNPLLSLGIKRGSRLIGSDAFTGATLLLKKGVCEPDNLPLSTGGMERCIQMMETALLGPAVKRRKWSKENTEALRQAVVDWRNSAPTATPTQTIAPSSAGDEIAVLIDGPSSENTTQGKAIVRWPELDTKDQLVFSQWGQTQQTLVFDAEDEEDFQAELADMARQMRAKQEETGTHTLFLTVGMLRWREQSDSKHCDAPLFLIPVELSRENAASRFKISVRDDGIELNPAIDVHLKNILGLDLSKAKSLLASEEYEDVQALSLALEAVKQSITNLPAAKKELIEIRNEARLTLLSYAKNRMWQDLEQRSKEVLKHPVITQIINPNRLQKKLSEGEIANWERMDQNHPPDQIMLPMAADASQLRAIVRADSGENLVIQGPPGTGKSQTIANLIANFLGKGKRVLFVAEKMTALTVVQQRLNAIGLGPFCLELHASRANKAGVLEQLREGLEARSLPAVSGFSERAAEIQANRIALNNSLEVLHAVYPNSLTAHRAIGLLAGTSSEIKILPTLSFMGILTEDAFAQPSRQEALRRYLAALKVMPTGARVFDVLENCPPKDAAVFFEIIQSWRQERSQIENLASKAGIAIADKTNADMDLFFNHISAWLIFDSSKISRIESSEEMGLAFLTQTIWDKWNAFEDADKETAESFTPFSKDYQSSIWGNAGASSIRQEWLEVEQALAPIRWWKRKALVRRLSIHRKDKHTTGNHLDTLMRAWPDIMDNRQAAAAALKEWQEAAGITDIKRLPEARKIAESIKPLWEMIDTWKEEDRIPFLETLRNEIIQPNSQVKRNNPQLEELVQLIGSVIHTRQRLDRFLKPATEGKLLRTLNEMDNVMGPWHDAQSLWPAWDAARRMEETARQWGLGPLIDCIENNQIEASLAPHILEKSWLTSFVNQILLRHPEHTDFLGESREQIISTFARTEEEFEHLTRKHLAASVAQRARSAEIEKLPGMAILRRELAKQIRHLPPRRLLREIAAIAPIIKPCMLMSPMTVAEVLCSETLPFDVVIFDEASQIPVADAVGAISHGKQVIVVGDPKQMPPNTTFQVDNDDDELDDEDTLKDMESVLDECLVTMNHEMLNWHYRSRHEDLIAFSNYRYYNGDLITFPSISIGESIEDISSENSLNGIFVNQINGIYERGTAQVNRIEANAIVDGMRKHVEQSPHLSLGVVTFNQKQQRLIERLWDRVLRDNPGLEAKAEAMHQDLFVKNLDNVQGDERDVIFFSTTFGVDAAGKMAMNFGPLNRLGGERRLNVAITRARQRMEIFTSFSPDQLDVRTVKHQGPVDLRDYLAFAQGGAKALAGLSSASVGLPDSPFEIAVAEALRARGWTVHEQIGCSGYKIDLAVVDPRSPGRYLAGVECDGATYHSFKIARDRDRQRQKILEGLGWKILRVWSTDWFQDAKNELDQVDNALRAILEKPN